MRDGTLGKPLKSILRLETEAKERNVELENHLEEAGGRATILLVDDERVLLDILQEMLRRFGYTTLTAESGEQAIEIFKEQKGKVDLVILDLSMPGMGGDDCLKTLLRMDPETRVIISSGYSVNRKVEENLRSGAIGFIPKPYRQSEITRVIREALHQTS